MKLSTRLLLPLLVAVALVMLLYGSWALRQREASLVADAARETHAYATALGLAIERALRHPDPDDVQEVIDGVSREPTIHGVFIYDGQGGSRFRSEPVRDAPPAPEAVLSAALARGEPVAFERTLGGMAVHSVVRPLRDDAGRVTGALEVVQPLTFLESDKARVRQRYLLNTATLLLAVIVLVAWLVRRVVSRPLERFSAAVRTLGSGELAHRLDVGAAGGELAEVAQELNRMAAHLEKAQADLVREAEERLALERRLRQSERLAAMGELAAGVAHEIAAPLHVIRGRTDLLVRQGADSSSRARNLRIIGQQIDRITHIVKNLLTFARRREPRSGTVDLTEVLGGVVEFLEDELRRAGVELLWDTPSRAVVPGDPDLLHQVFLNLLMNALHAVEAVDEGPRAIHLRIGPSRDAETQPALEVEVRDTGAGIASEIGDRVFEPFFTTKAASQGTGLGLSVARAIVEDHGGRIDVAPAEPRGAAFRVILPAGIAPAPEKATSRG